MAWDSTRPFGRFPSENVDGDQRRHHDPLQNASMNQTWRHSAGWSQPQQRHHPQDHTRQPTTFRYRWSNGSRNFPSVPHNYAIPVAAAPPASIMSARSSRSSCIRRSHVKVMAVVLFLVILRLRQLGFLMSNDDVKTMGNGSITAKANSRGTSHVRKRHGSIAAAVALPSNPIVRILGDAGIIDEELKHASVARIEEALNSKQPNEPSTINPLSIPDWSAVQDLYGASDKPIIHGLETCSQFRNLIQASSTDGGLAGNPSTPFIGVSGMFNSGTTAFGRLLQANCRFRHHPNNHSNSKVQDVNGMLSQVPWAKHKDARSRWNHTIIDDIPKQHVLPVVLVRDPYFWMQSMCKEGYGARWSHSPKHHCPNLVPNEYDRRRFARLRNATSTTVWMGENQRVGPNWPSLIHYWNDWYRSYVSEADFPRLIIRFEDTLYHGEEVMRQVCECAGAEPLKPFTYLVDNAKSDHKQAKNDFAAAVLKYGNEDGRYRNMTSDDLTFARLNVDKELLRMFHYKLPDSRLEQQREVDEGKRQRQRH